MLVYWSWLVHVCKIVDKDHILNIYHILISIYNNKNYMYKSLKQISKIEFDKKKMIISKHPYRK